MAVLGFELYGKGTSPTGDCAKVNSKSLPRQRGMNLVLNCTEKGPAPKAAGREFHRHSEMSLVVGGFLLLGNKGPDLQKTGDCAKVNSKSLPRQRGMTILGFELYGKGTSPKSCREGNPCTQRVCRWRVFLVFSSRAPPFISKLVQKNGSSRFSIGSLTIGSLLIGSLLSAPFLSAHCPLAHAHIVITYSDII